MDLAAIIVSVLALVVSGLSVRFTREQAKAQRRATQIEEDRRADELEVRARELERRESADLRVTLSHPEANNSQRISVQNIGEHTAKDIHLVYLDANDGGAAPDTGPWNTLPQFLAPGEISSVPAWLYYETTHDFRVVVEWIDGRGPQQVKVRLTDA